MVKLENKRFLYGVLSVIVDLH